MSAFFVKKQGVDFQKIHTINYENPYTMCCGVEIRLLDLSRIQKQKTFSIVLNKNSAYPGEMN